MILGLLALALPTGLEGMQLWQIDEQHTLYVMDLAGVFVLILGYILTWLGSKFWNHYVTS